MNAINQLIQMGYEIELSSTGEINCNFRRDTQPDEKEVYELINKITADVPKAAQYVSTLITLKVDTQPNGDFKEWVNRCAGNIEEQDTGEYSLKVRAFDYNKKPMLELFADTTGTDRKSVV